MPRRMPTLVVSSAAMLAASLAGCGGGGGSAGGGDSVSSGRDATTTTAHLPATSTSSSNPVAQPGTGAAAASEIPSVQVVDVSTGERVNLASLAPAALPVLAWFWAPH